MVHQFPFILMQALENLILDRHPDHPHQADLFRHWMAEEAYLDHAPSLIR